MVHNHQGLSKFHGSKDSGIPEAHATIVGQEAVCITPPRRDVPISDIAPYVSTRNSILLCHYPPRLYQAVYANVIRRSLQLFYPHGHSGYFQHSYSTLLRFEPLQPPQRFSCGSVPSEILLRNQRQPPNQWPL